MKLIIERTEFGIYAYTETEKHHRRVEPSRSDDVSSPSTRLDPKVLDHDCDLELLPENSYIVFNLKR